MRLYTFLFAIIFISRAAVAQQDPNDLGQADTLALEIGYFQPYNQDVNLAVEAWVYSDNPILTFISGFKWDNSALHLDSAKPAAILSENNLTLFFFFDDYMELLHVHILTKKLEHGYWYFFQEFF